MPSDCPAGLNEREREHQIRELIRAATNFSGPGLYQLAAQITLLSVSPVSVEGPIIEQANALRGITNERPRVGGHEIPHPPVSVEGEGLHTAKIELEIMGNFLAAGSFTPERVAIMRRRVDAALAILDPLSAPVPSREPQNDKLEGSTETPQSPHKSVPSREPTDNGWKRLDEIARVMWPDGDGPIEWDERVGAICATLSPSREPTPSDNEQTVERIAKALYEAGHASEPTRTGTLNEVERQFTSTGYENESEKIKSRWREQARIALTARSASTGEDKR